METIELLFTRITNILSLKSKVISRRVSGVHSFIQPRFIGHYYRFNTALGAIDLGVTLESVLDLIPSKARPPYLIYKLTVQRYLEESTREEKRESARKSSDLVI